MDAAEYDQRLYRNCKRKGTSIFQIYFARGQVCAMHVVQLLHGDMFVLCTSFNFCMGTGLWYARRSTFAWAQVCAMHVVQLLQTGTVHTEIMAKKGR